MKTLCAIIRASIIGSSTKDLFPDGFLRTGRVTCQPSICPWLDCRARLRKKTALHFTDTHSGRMIIASMRSSKRSSLQLHRIKLQKRIIEIEQLYVWLHTKRKVAGEAQNHATKFVITPANGTLSAPNSAPKVLNERNRWEIIPPLVCFSLSSPKPGVCRNLTWLEKLRLRRLNIPRLANMLRQRPFEMPRIPLSADSGDRMKLQFPPLG